MNLFPHVSKDVVKAITALAHSLRHEKDDTLKDLAGNFSTRQLLRIARRLSVFPKDSIYSCILKVSLYRFLPVMAKEALLSYVSKHNIVQDEPEALDLQVQIIVDVKGIEVLKIGDVECPTAVDSNPLLVPNILFYENQRQITILQDVLKDYTLGEHLLLIGNQGVGKNKIVDYFLQKMKLPREYIQLHRDTTVYSLTSSPAIVNGKLRALRLIHILCKATRTIQISTDTIALLASKCLIGHDACRYKLTLNLLTNEYVPARQTIKS